MIILDNYKHHPLVVGKKKYKKDKHHSLMFLDNNDQIQHNIR